MMRFSRFRRFLAAKNYLYLLLLVVVLGSAYPLVADFYTKGEPREALVAQAMLEDGEFILPRVYGDEVAYKPPMFHWLVAASSIFTDGHVTPLSARLPSAVAFFVLAAGLFLFISQRRPISLALMSALLFVTMLDPHRFGIMARVDMLLTAFVVLALFELYAWDEKEGRRRIPWRAVLLMSGGFLTKGPVGLVLPLLIFFIFSCFRRYPLGQVILKLVLVGLLASVLPLVWYYLAWQRGGETFLQIVWNENFLRFLGINDNTLFYPLGHEGRFFKPIVYFILGLTPWMLLVFFFRWSKKTFALTRISPLNLFALIATLTTLVFYMIPMSKSSSYLLPMYPFVALLVGEGLYLLIKREDRRLVYFSVLISGVSIIFLLAMFALQLGVNPDKIGGNDLAVFSEGLKQNIGLSIFGELLIVVGLLTVAYQMMRKNYHKLAFAVIFLSFILHFNVDVPVMTHFKAINSARPFAEEVAEKVGDEPLYITSDLTGGYYNLYGLAFYANKRPLELRTANPQEGYMVIWEKDYERMQADPLREYTSVTLGKDSKAIKEGGTAMLLYIRKR